MTKQENTDIRTYNVQIRADTPGSTGQMKISGTAAVFNQPSMKGQFIEYISPKAFNGVDLSQVLLLYSHDFSNILARADSNTLATSVDNQGLHFSAQLPDTQLGHDTYTNILNGNIKGMSFGFTITPTGDAWSTDSQGNTIHTINQIDQVFELSLTPVPAYAETSVAVQRSLDKFVSNKGAKETMATKPEEKKSEETKPTAAPEKPAEKAAEPKQDASTEIASLADEVAALQKVVKSLSQPAKPAPAKVENRDDDPTDDQPVEQDEKKPAMQKRDAVPTEQNTQDGGQAMAKNLTADKVESEEVRDFQEFLKTGVIKRDAAGFDSNAGEAVLPSQVLDVMAQPKDPAQLSNYVTKVQVTAPTGKLPVLAKASAQLLTTEELAENPQLANASLTPVNYDVATRRGQLPISLEMTQDYPQIVGLLTQYVNDIKAQTEQHQIGEVLQKAKPVTAASIDDLKDAYNIGLTNYGNDRMWVLSESMFAQLDKAKDANGRYLLQDSVASATGQTFLGKTLLVVPDDVLITAPTDPKAPAPESRVAFVGSLKNFVLETIKGNINLAWSRNENFEQVLLAALRADFEVADKAAGKFITFTPASK